MDKSMQVYTKGANRSIFGASLMVAGGIFFTCILADKYNPNKDMAYLALGAFSGGGFVVSMTGLITMIRAHKPIKNANKSYAKF